MTLTASIIDAMLASGCTAEQMAAVMKAALADAEAKAAEKRAKDEERQRKSRANRTVSHPVTVTPRDKCDTPLDKETPPTPPKEIKPPLPPSSSNEDDTPTAEKPEKPDALKPEHVIEVWNNLAERYRLPRVMKLTPQRRRTLACRIREHSIEDWTEAIAAIEQNPWLRGENDRGWRADFDFLLQPKSFTKLIEGGYDRA